MNNESHRRDSSSKWRAGNWSKRTVGSSARRRCLYAGSENRDLVRSGVGNEEVVSVRRWTACRCRGDARAARERQSGGVIARGIAGNQCEYTVRVVRESSQRVSKLVCHV